jgi:serine/threonine protein kinase
MTFLGDRRSSQYACQLLPDCQVEVEIKDLVIISYAYIPGTHFPTHVGHLTELFSQLCYLHEEVGIVHGDIRLSNLIFNDHEGEGGEEKKGQAQGEGEGVEIEHWKPHVTIIDFDFSGEAGVKSYPEGYNREIEDGERHPDATGGKVLQPEHDVFSCLYLCRLYLSPESFPSSPTPISTARVMFDHLSNLDQDTLLSPRAHCKTNATGSPNGNQCAPKCDHWRKM